MLDELSLEIDVILKNYKKSIDGERVVELLFVVISLSFLTLKI